MEMASASPQSRTASRGNSSQFPRTEEGGGPGNEELEEELMFDIDANLVALDGARPSLGAQSCQGHRPKFPPSLFGVKAYTGEIDHSIANTRLQHSLKRQPFAQTQKAQVCSLFSFNCQI